MHSTNNNNNNNNNHNRLFSPCEGATKLGKRWYKSRQDGYGHMSDSARTLYLPSFLRHEQQSFWRVLCYCAEAAILNTWVLILATTVRITVSDVEHTHTTATLKIFLIVAPKHFGALTLWGATLPHQENRVGNNSTQYSTGTNRMRKVLCWCGG